MVMSVVMVCYPALEVEMVVARMVRSRGTMVGWDCAADQELTVLYQHPEMNDV